MAIEYLKEKKYKGILKFRVSSETLDPEPGSWRALRKPKTEVMQTERVAIADEARMSIQEVLDRYNSGILIQLVQLQGVTPPEPVADSFNEVNRAKQDQETLHFF